MTNKDKKYIALMQEALKHNPIKEAKDYCKLKLIMFSSYNFLCLLLFGLIINIAPLKAQDIVREGNTFTNVKTKGEDKPTDYKYIEGGETYVVFLSSTGKAFIWKTSKKTGKLYKKYLPEIGKIINPKAYETTKKQIK